ncbi:MAG: DUF559 domain-containing protein [Actinomycetota bacterium]|nr:DUF559 domain-containing protein [Actinomycetota bacterium]
MRLVRRASSGTRLEGEQVLLRLLRGSRLSGWEVNPLVYDARGLIGEVDVAFVAARVAIEVDGLAWHVDADRFQRARTKQNRLVAAGWVVLRFTWQDLTQRPDEVIARIAAAVAARS